MLLSEVYNSSLPYRAQMNTGTHFTDIKIRHFSE